MLPENKFALFMIAPKNRSGRLWWLKERENMFLWQISWQRPSVLQYIIICNYFKRRSILYFKTYYRKCIMTKIVAGKLVIFFVVCMGSVITAIMHRQKLEETDPGV